MVGALFGIELGGWESLILRLAGVSVAIGVIWRMVIRPVALFVRDEWFRPALAKVAWFLDRFDYMSSRVDSMANIVEEQWPLMRLDVHEIKTWQHEHDEIYGPLGAQHVAVAAAPDTDDKWGPAS